MRQKLVSTEEPVGMNFLFSVMTDGHAHRDGVGACGASFQVFGSPTAKQAFSVVSVTSHYQRLCPERRACSHRVRLDL